MPFRLFAYNPDLSFDNNGTKEIILTTDENGEILIDGEKMDIPADFTLEISTKPSVSSIKKYTDILTLTEENIEDLKDNIEENLDKIEEDLTDQAKDSD